MHQEVIGHKINTQKPITFPYMNNELSEKENERTISHAISSKEKFLYIQTYTSIRQTENYKILTKILSKTPIQRHPHSWAGRMNASILPNTICRSACSVWKCQQYTLHRKDISKLHMEPQKVLNNQCNLKQTEQSYRITVT